MSGEHQPLLPKEETSVVEQLSQPKDEEIGFADRIVDQRQFQLYPWATLQCARCVWICILGGVLVTIAALLFGLFHGRLEVETTTIKHEHLPLRRMVICPSWGQTDMKLNVKALMLGNLFTTSEPDWKRQNFTANKCPPFKYYEFRRETPYLSDMKELEKVNAMGCICIDSDVELAPHAVGKDFARVALSAEFTQDPTKMLSIGFNDGGVDYPGDWNYVGIGARTVADLTLETYVYGRTPFTRGTGIELYTFGVKNAMTLPESQRVDGADTEVVVAYGSYYDNQILDFSAVFSFFAMVTFAAIIIATINSLQIFNLCFPEVVDPNEPQQLQPSMLFQWTLGSCLPCCRRKKDFSDS